MTILPREIEVYYIIPSIRKEIASYLKKKGFKQKEIARILGVSEACVSNYFKSKRASFIDLPPQIKNKIYSACDDLENKCLVGLFEQICDDCRNTKFLCKIHKMLDKTCGGGCCNA